MYFIMDKKGGIIPCVNGNKKWHDKVNEKYILLIWYIKLDPKIQALYANGKWGPDI